MSTTQDALLARYADSVTGVFGRPAACWCAGRACTCGTPTGAATRTCSPESP